MLDEKFRLQQESKALSEHLNALLKDKFGMQEDKGFDSDTPIDKALTFLQFIIAVCFSNSHSSVSRSSCNCLGSGRRFFAALHKSCHHSFCMITVSSPVHMLYVLAVCQSLQDYCPASCLASTQAAG